MTRLDSIYEDEWPAYLQGILSTHERASYEDEISKFHEILSATASLAFEHGRAPEGHPSGGDWEEWMWRRKEYHAEDRTLVNSGRLWSSFFRGGPDNIDEFSGREGTYGSNVEYSGLHQHGGFATPIETLTKRGTDFETLTQDTIEVQPRPFLWASEAQVDTFAMNIANELEYQMEVGN